MAIAEDKFDDLLGPVRHRPGCRTRHVAAAAKPLAAQRGLTSAVARVIENRAIGRAAWMASRLAAERDANRVIDELERIAFGAQAATGGREPTSARRYGLADDTADR